MTGVMSAVSATGKGKNILAGDTSIGQVAKTAATSDSNVPAQTNATNMASNFGLVGGAADSAGASITGWIDRLARQKQARQAQANLDRAFDENLRRFGLNFALNEFATRKGIALQEAQMLFNQQSSRVSQSAALTAQGLQTRNMTMDLKERKRKQKIAQAFAKGFSKASVGGK